AERTGRPTALTRAGGPPPRRERAERRRGERSGVASETASRRAERRARAQPGPGGRGGGPGAKACRRAAAAGERKGGRRGRAARRGERNGVAASGAAAGEPSYGAFELPTWSRFNANTPPTMRSAFSRIAVMPPNAFHARLSSGNIHRSRITPVSQSSPTY